MGNQTLRVGYRPTPGLIWPKLENSGQLEGFEYDLLVEMAHRLGVSLDFVCMDNEVSLMQGICGQQNKAAQIAQNTTEASQSIQVAVGALQGSSRLEEKLDILFPHARSSTVVLVKKSVGYWVKEALEDLCTSWVSRALLAGGILFCYVPALLTTLAEQKIPGSSFESASANPFLTAAWYAVVTISTVGYGDLSPVTSFGRVLAAPMIAFAPLLYVGLVQQLWTTFKDAFFRVQSLDGDTLRTHSNLETGAVVGTEAYQSVRCDVGCCDITDIEGYASLIEAARKADTFDVLVVDAPVAAYILRTFPMKWSLGQEISTGLGYSCLVPTVLLLQ